MKNNISELDKLKMELKNNKSFKFSAQLSWLNWVMFLSFLFVGIFGVYQGSGSSGHSPFLVFGIIALIGAPIILIVNIKMLSEKMEITSEGITWEGGFMQRQIKFKEIKDIRYYRETTIQGSTPLDTDLKARFILNNGRSFKKSFKYWRTPGHMKSFEYIRTIVEYYYFLANPNKLLELLE